VTERHDGRAPSDLREISFEPDCLDFATGSCEVRFGRTRVLCAASVDERVPGWLAGKGRGWVTAEYSMLPAATPSRSKRESEVGKIKGRTHEIQRLIGRSLRACVDMERLGEIQIRVDCDVLQADGGTRTASITGGYVALGLAIQRLTHEGRLSPDASPLIRSVAAVSAGLVDGRAILDLDYIEDSGADVDMNMVFTGEAGLVEIQGTAEGAPFRSEDLASLLDLGRQGAAILTARQRKVLGAR
jgi:ribonuclease PH